MPLLPPSCWVMKLPFLPLSLSRLVSSRMHFAPALVLSSSSSSFSPLFSALGRNEKNKKEEEKEKSRRRSALLFSQVTRAAAAASASSSVSTLTTALHTPSDSLHHFFAPFFSSSIPSSSFFFQGAFCVCAHGLIPYSSDSSRHKVHRRERKAFRLFSSSSSFRQLFAFFPRTTAAAADLCGSRIE